MANYCSEVLLYAGVVNPAIDSSFMVEKWFLDLKKASLNPGCLSTSLESACYSSSSTQPFWLVGMVRTID